MSSKSKARPKTPDLSQEELIAAEKKKRLCRAIASTIVESLLKPNTEPANFVQMLKLINQCHYEDVVEERFILKLCGYPICDKVLTDIPTKKYQISTAVNKVYDITYRKKFCSTKCYKSSEFIKEQMLTSPLWMRDQEVLPEFVLLGDEPNKS